MFSLLSAEWGLVLTQVLAAGGDEDGWGNIGWIFLFSGIVFYGIQYTRYRNTDKRHYHEKETEALRVKETGGDQFVQARKGLKNKTMQGANHRAVRGARAANTKIMGIEIPKF